jgi:hypothetical protein
VAVVIDLVLLGLVVWPVAVIIALAIGLAGGSVGMPDLGVHLVARIVRSGLLLFAGWIYEAALESSSKQATVGKMVFGLRVTDMQGQRISFASYGPPFRENHLEIDSPDRLHHGGIHRAQAGTPRHDRGDAGYTDAVNPKAFNRKGRKARKVTSFGEYDFALFASFAVKRFAPGTLRLKSFAWLSSLALTAAAARRAAFSATKTP